MPHTHTHPGGYVVGMSDCHIYAADYLSVHTYQPIEIAGCTHACGAHALIHASLAHRRFPDTQSRHQVTQYVLQKCKAQVPRRLFEHHEYKSFDPKLINTLWRRLNTSYPLDTTSWLLHRNAHMSKIIRRRIAVDARFGNEILQVVRAGGSLFVADGGQYWGQAFQGGRNTLGLVMRAHVPLHLITTNNPGLKKADE